MAASSEQLTQIRMSENPNNEIPLQSSDDVLAPTIQQSSSLAERLQAGYLHEENEPNGIDNSFRNVTQTFQSLSQKQTGEIVVNTALTFNHQRVDNYSPYQPPIELQSAQPVKKKCCLIC